MRPFLFIDLAGLTLSADEKLLLNHPLVAGVVLFARNYAGVTQLYELIQQIRAVRPNLWVAVDQEGGSVQRFTEPFTNIPAMQRLGEQYALDAQQTYTHCAELGWLIGAELAAVGVDINFSPVLDRGIGLSDVITDRAFSADPNVIITLASALIQGMQSAHILAVGKHFPGHGAVKADSHHALPVDGRSYEIIKHTDMQPFTQLIDTKVLSAIMMSHVVYEQVAALPAGFSSTWVKAILQQALGFSGFIFTDCLSMAASQAFGSADETIKMALAAGCHYVLLCNYAGDMRLLLSQLEKNIAANDVVDLPNFAVARPSHKRLNWQALRQMERYQSISTWIVELER